MTTQRLTCRLYELDGAHLADGTYRMETAPAAMTTLLVAVARPGPLIQRCLLGPVREVLVEFDCGARQRALVARVFFDRQLGRACELRIAEKWTVGLCGSMHS